MGTGQRVRQQTEILRNHSPDKGTPHGTAQAREAGRVGQQRTPETLPAQAAGKQIQNVTTYHVGPPKRPEIKWDNGFLQNNPPREPTLVEQASLLKWRAILEGAEAFAPHLSDATAAYRHFLYGHGRPRTCSYERYVLNDASGRITLHNAILSIQWGVMQLWKAFHRQSFRLTSNSAIKCGVQSSTMFPYPATENWQKAIGYHVIWLSGNVRVTQNSAAPSFHLDMTLHAEDRYNFNPDAEDIATGTKDAVNGLFELTGQAHGYTNTSTLHRSISWVGNRLGNATLQGTPQSRVRQPQDNLRVRNRI